MNSAKRSIAQVLVRKCLQCKRLGSHTRESFAWADNSWNLRRHAMKESEHRAGARRDGAFCMSTSQELPTHAHARTALAPATTSSWATKGPPSTSSFAPTTLPPIHVAPIKLLTRPQTHPLPARPLSQDVPDPRRDNSRATAAAATKSIDDDAFSTPKTKFRSSSTPASPEVQPVQPEAGPSGLFADEPEQLPLHDAAFSTVSIPPGASEFDFTLDNIGSGSFSFSLSLDAKAKDQSEPVAGPSTTHNPNVGSNVSNGIGTSHDVYSGAFNPFADGNEAAGNSSASTEMDGDSLRRSRFDFARRTTSNGDGPIATGLNSLPEPGSHARTATNWPPGMLPRLPLHDKLPPPAADEPPPFWASMPLPPASSSSSAYSESAFNRGGMAFDSTQLTSMSAAAQPLPQPASVPPGFNLARSPLPASAYPMPPHSARTPSGRGEELGLGRAAMPLPPATASSFSDGAGMYGVHTPAFQPLDGRQDGFPYAARPLPPPPPHASEHQRFMPMARR